MYNAWPKTSILFKESNEFLNLKETGFENGSKAKIVASNGGLKQKKNLSTVNEICKKKIPQMNSRRITYKKLVLVKVFIFNIITMNKKRTAIAPT